MQTNVQPEGLLFMPDANGEPILIKPGSLQNSNNAVVIASESLGNGKMRTVAIPLGKGIANAIALVDGFTFRLYVELSGSGINSIPVVITSGDGKVSNFSFKDTANQEIKYYPDGTPNYTVKGVNVDLSSFNGTGKYLRIYTETDSPYDYPILYGNNAQPFNENTVIGIYSTAVLFQVDIQDFGGPLSQATPFNVELVNNTTKTPNIDLYSEYYIKKISTAGAYQTAHWQYWDYINPHWSLDMTNETQNIRFDLYAINYYGNPGYTLIGQGWAYAGSNYQGNNWMGQIQDYNTRYFKIEMNYF